MRPISEQVQEPVTLSVTCLAIYLGNRMINNQQTIQSVSKLANQPFNQTAIYKKSVSQLVSFSSGQPASKTNYLVSRSMN